MMTDNHRDEAKLLYDVANSNDTPTDAEQLMLQFAVIQVGLAIVEQLERIANAMDWTRESHGY